MTLMITRMNGRRWAFDTVITATYDPPVLLTSNPLEDGTSVTDHSQKLPEQWTAECVVSGSPDVGNELLSRADGWPASGRARHEACEQFLRDALGEVVFVNFRGRINRYFIAAAPYPINNRVGVVFVITFQDVNIALQTTTTLPRLAPGKGTNKPKPNPNPSPNGNDPTNKGNTANGAVSESFAETLVRGGPRALGQRLGYIATGR